MYGVLDRSYFCKRYAIEEAINNLKQLCHPSMIDEPDALVNIKVEFDMRANKKDRYNFFTHPSCFRIFCTLVATVFPTSFCLFE